MRDTRRHASERRVCRVLGVSWTAIRRRSTERAPTPRRVNPLLASRLEALIQRYPTFGYRRLWAWLRFRDGQRITPKTVYRALAVKGWFAHQRPVTPRPRAAGVVSRTDRSNVRWAADLTHVFCGRDGWAHLAVVRDCQDRECIGWEFARRGRAKEAERALEEACLARFGTLRPTGPTPVVRSDNGLIYQSRRFRPACRDYRLGQEFITPYTPEQNGIVERFFRSLKEECAWQHVFRNFAEARHEITAWIRGYNIERPHQALGYRSPTEWRAQQCTQGA